MTEWRRKAIAIFPDRLVPLQRAMSLHDAWFTLLLDLQGAYRAVPPNTDLIERIWSFAAWCYDPARHATVRGTVAVSFYEHLPEFGPARRELPQRLSRRVFEELLPEFKVVMTVDELAAFVDEFLTAQGLDKKAIRAFWRAAS